MKRLLLLLLLANLACAPVAPGGPAPTDSGPPAVILFIGDGTSLAYWSAAKLASRTPLAIEAFPVVGLVDTQSANSRITDSAAGATAFASGVRTYNGAIGMGPDSVALPSVLDQAEAAGWATGLVATSSVTHATPAAFAAHVPSRNMHFAIARQMAHKGIDVLLGGGRRFFQAGSREDGVDLLGIMEGSAIVLSDPEVFLALDPDTVSALVGLFAENHPGPALERSPTLGQLTETALRVLERDEDGFFLMVEGSQIDWRGHENAPLGEVLAEVQDLDRAIERALRFRERRPNTLIVVVADHATGGLAVHPDEDDGTFRAHYTTEGHTADLVPMFAIGPGSEPFAGVMNNDRVGRLLLERVGDGEAPRPASGVITESGAR